MGATHFSGPVYSAAGFATGEPGAVGAQGRLANRRAGIADAAPTTVMQITVPNGIQAAGIFLDFLAHLENGESARIAQGSIVVSRKANVAAVAASVALAAAAIATVAAGGTFTLAYTVGAAVGANNATQTFAVSVTTTGTPAGTTVVMLSARVMNSMDSGVTVAAV